MFSKINIFSILFFFIASTTYVFSQDKIYYNDGKLLGDGQMVNKEKQGSWTLYHRTGEVFGKGNYLDDKQNGPWTLFMPSGLIVQKGTYKNGKKIGEWFEADNITDVYNMVKNNYVDGELIPQKSFKSYHQTGELHATVGLKDGEKNGIYKALHKDGSIRAEGKYVNGNEVGKWNKYYENGKLESKEYFIDGENEGTSE